MDAQNYWFSSGAAGGGGDPGDPIGESLRFRGAQNLNRNFTGTSNSYTFSFWTKLAAPDSWLGYLFSAGSNNPSLLKGQVTNSGLLYNQDAGGATGTISTTPRRFRDPSAWYHVVYQSDAGTHSIFINGELSSTPNTGSNNYNGTFRIGVNTDGSSAPFQGYMADWYAMDGLALPPECFGRENADGVWVPRTGSREDLATPREFNAADYGAGGFHLLFQNIDNIGQDTAPIGTTGHTAANNFTNNGFNFDLVGVFSNDLTTNTSFSGTNPPTQAFDNNTNSFCLANGVGGTNTTITFAPTTPIALTSLQVFSPGFTDQTITFGGQTTNLSPASTWVPINIGTATEISTTSTLVLTRNTAGESARLIGIRINGTTVLVDNTGVDYDSMDDSPTQNWATLNPLPPRSSGTIQDACLEADIGSLNQYIWGTQAMTSPCYWETRFISGDPFEVGLVDIRSTTRDSFLGGTGGNTYGYGTNGQITNNATSGATTYTTWGVNDVISQAYDPETGRWWAAVNGVWVGGGDPAAGTDALHLPPNTGTNDQLPEDQREFMTPGFGPNGGTSAINFGQQPFLFPVPNGFEALQTQNMPDVTITNGRDQFQAITGPGSGPNAGEANTLAGPWSKYFVRQTDPTSQAGITNIPQGFNNRTNNNLSFGANQHSMFAPTGDDVIDFTTSIEVWLNGPAGVPWGWFDNGLGNATTTPQSATTGAWTQIGVGPGQISLDRPIGGGAIGTGATLAGIRVDGNVLVDQGILPQAQSVFNTGLWWIKDMVNTNQHQLVDSVRGAGTAFTCPGSLTQNYAAPAGDSVAWCWNLLDTPADNGFNIIEYTGNSNAGGTNTQNVAHNLGGIPDFFINFRIGDTVNARTPWVWHGSAPVADQRLQLNSNIAGSTITNFWGQPTATDLVFGPGDNTNANGFDFITYVWRAVPGYSAFGVYQGNSNTDGPVIVTGFRPAFVMTKCTNVASTSWTIMDSTENPTNPATSYLMPNTTSSTNTDLQFDFLSNGFKLRLSSNQTNKTNQTYVYCCFAENPFGGSNVSPVTAR